MSTGPEDIRVERIGTSLVVHAGKGESYNQPHDEPWDMAEDVAAIPPARWHLEIQRAIDFQGDAYCRLVVDVSEMFWLVGQDWGFLVSLCERLRSRRCAVAILGSERIQRCVRTLGLEDRIEVYDTLRDAARGAEA